MHEAHSLWRHWLACLALLLILPTVASAAAVNLSWESPLTNQDGSPLDDLAGYRVHYGPATGSYTAVLDVGVATAVTLSNLADATRYFFVVSAYDKSGNESPFSPEVQAMTASGTLALVAQINFQPSAAVTPTGYKADTGAVYSSTRGYGWSVDQRNDTRKRGVQADPRLDTFAFTEGTAVTWRIHVPNGNYYVSFASGDPSYDQGPHKVLLQGKTVVDNVVTALDQYVVRTRLPATVTDGFIRLRIGGTTGSSLLNYVILEK